MAADLRAHRDQKIRQVGDLGFHRGVGIVVVPSANTAASIAFLVAPTLGIRNSISPPRSRLPFARDQIAVASGPRNRAQGMLVRACRSRAFRACSRPEAALRRVRNGRATVRRSRTMPPVCARVRRARGACDIRWHRSSRCWRLLAQTRAQRFEQRPHHRDVGDARNAMQRHLALGEQAAAMIGSAAFLAPDVDAALEPRAAATRSVVSKRSRRFMKRSLRRAEPKRWFRRRVRRR